MDTRHAVLRSGDEPCNSRRGKTSGLFPYNGPWRDRMINGELTMHKEVGSDVAGVLNNDHAQAAEEFLRQAHFDDKWQVVVADGNKLMLDYDNYPYDGTLPEHIYGTDRK